MERWKVNRMMYNESLYGNYRTRRFTEIWDNVNDFLEDYNKSGIPASIRQDSATTLYYLLYARFGNSNIASSDETQFKYKLFSIIFSYGPTWEKRLELQTNIRNLTIEQLQAGNKTIYNKALHDGDAPSTMTLEEITAISEQNTANYKRSVSDAYALQYSLLETDVTERFLNEFKRLFITIVVPQQPLWYVTEEDTEDE